MATLPRLSRISTVFIRQQRQATAGRTVTRETPGRRFPNPSPRRRWQIVLFWSFQVPRYWHAAHSGNVQIYHPPRAVSSPVKALMLRVARPPYILRVMPDAEWLRHDLFRCGSPSSVSSKRQQFEAEQNLSTLRRIGNRLRFSFPLLLRGRLRGGRSNQRPPPQAGFYRLR